MKIFYSWQSWSPRKTNWGFIQDAIEEAITKIKADQTLEVEPVLDRDTQGKAGSVAIADTIFQKIDECKIFICDVTIVAETQAKQSIPNPNVLIELGYAVARLGWENVICVFNEAYGTIESMPFDLRHRRLLKYKLLENAGEKSDQKRKLTAGIEEAIRIIIQNIQPDVPKISPVARLKQLIPNTDGQIELEELLREEVQRTRTMFTGSEFYAERNTLINQHNINTEKQWSDCFQLYFSACENVLMLFAN